MFYKLKSFFTWKKWVHEQIMAFTVFQSRIGSLVLVFDHKKEHSEAEEQTCVVHQQKKPDLSTIFTEDWYYF